MKFTREEKNKLLEKYKNSKQTQKAFTESNGIKLKTFQRWLHDNRQQKNHFNTGFVEIKGPTVQSFRNIIIRKAGIEIELASFDETSFSSILNAINAL